MSDSFPPEAITDVIEEIHEAVDDGEETHVGDLLERRRHLVDHRRLSLEVLHALLEERRFLVQPLRHARLAPPSPVIAGDCPTPESPSIVAMVTRRPGGASAACTPDRLIPLPTRSS